MTIVHAKNGRGIYFAIDRTKTHIHKYFRQNNSDNGYVLKIDIKKFFENIPHKQLKEMLNKKIKNLYINEILFEMIESNKLEKGIGLGCQINQLLAVSFLSPLDHMIKQKLRIKHYIRYADDLLLIHKDKEYLKYCKNIIQKWLNQHKLQLNPKSCIYPMKQGIKFLNVRFILTKSGKIITKLSKESKHNNKRKYTKLVNFVKQNKISYTSYITSLLSYLSYSMHIQKNIINKYK